MSKSYQPAQLILASSSAFRRGLLEQLDVPFVVDPPDIDETALPGEDAPSLVTRLAVEKAQTVKRRHPEALIIGSDQVAVHGGVITGKPGDRETAIEQLLAASGKTVQLYTGLALVNASSGTLHSRVISYEVTYRVLNEDLIKRYLNREQPYNCCGSLRADGLGIALLTRMVGDDPSALIGLPLIALVELLGKENYRVV